MPLPLKEFYPITQAAELLECSVDDLIHWAIIGCIRLHVKIRDAIGIIESDVNYEIDDFIIGVNDKQPFCKLTTNDIRKLSHKDRFNMLNEFIKLHGVESITSIRRWYAALMCLNRGLIDEELCFVYKIKSDCLFEESYPCKVANNVDEASYDYLVKVSGFVGIGLGNFRYCEFHDKFDENYDDDLNYVVTPGNGVVINLISHENVKIEKSDIFILNEDFLIVSEASKNGGKIDKRHNILCMQSAHRWIGAPAIGTFVSERRTESNHIDRVSARARDAIRILVNLQYPDISNNPTKLAAILSAEAEAQGTPCQFNKTTVSNWLRK